MSAKQMQHCSSEIVGTFEIHRFVYNENTRSKSLPPLQ